MIAPSSRPYLLAPLFLFILLAGTYLLMVPETSVYLHKYLRISKTDTPTGSDQKRPLTKMLVVASTKDSNTSWIDKLDWEHSVYTPEPPLRNKGREANMYLAYIIDNYDNLRDITGFVHHHEKSWHVDAPGKSNVELLSHLRLSYVQQEGYVSLRCGNIPGGCNEFMRPYETNETTMSNWPAAYEYMFNEPAPKIVAAPCCAQFVVTKSQIQRRTKDDYKRYHQWLMDTPLPDHNSGRVLEFLWHIMFGKDAVHCVNTKSCWCVMYGWCDEGTFFG